jgi:hypothetical protein
MKITLILLTLLAGQVASAAWDGCEAQVNSLLNRSRDQFILKESHNFLDQNGLENCAGDLAANLMVAIHEGVHSIDLNLLKAESHSTGLYLITMRKLPIPSIDLPSPYEVFENLGSAWSSLQDLKRNGVVLEYEQYVLDRDTLASNDIKIGFGTEFNAYTHGALSSLSLLPISEEFERIKSISGYYGPLITQRTGIVGFFGLSNAYFHLLKTKRPSVWKKILADASIIEFYHQLFSQAIEVLQLTSHCDSVSSIERSYVAAVVPVMTEDVLPAFKIFIKPQDFKKLAICE